MKMKKQIKSRKKRTALLTTGGIIALILIMSLLYVYVLGGNIFGWTVGHPAKFSAPSAEEIKAGNKVKSDSVQTQNGKDSQTDHPPAPTPQSNSDKSLVQVAITTPSVSSDNGIYHIGAVIYAATNDGSCRLTLSNSNTSYDATPVGVQSQAMISGCKGFDIPASSLSPGKWEATLNFDSDSLTGTVTSTVTLE